MSNVAAKFRQGPRHGTEYRGDFYQYVAILETRQDAGRDTINQ